ncbi:MAG: MFS transporter [Candidatus Vogelbacteria bacterium]|nr:MFS transporter [Candidatus Vogelbacteria bacterium]
MKSLARVLPAQFNRIYLASFIFTVHYGFLVYIISSYLETFTDQSGVNFIFGAGAVGAIFALLFISQVLKKEGELKVTRVAIVLTILSAFGLAFARSQYEVALAGVIYFICEMIVWVMLDIYLENITVAKEAGNIRGHFLLAVNIAIALSPFIVGQLVGSVGYAPVFLISGLIMIPLLFIIRSDMQTIPRNKLQAYTPLTGFRKIWKKPDVMRIMSTYFLLEFFYSWMVIYSPIYLHNTIGLKWEQIGVVFTIMLIPFVLFELPLGRIADKRLGEKEILITGLVIMSVATISVSYITSASVIVWGIVLFITRTGASFIEIMNETYFFKKIRSTDRDIISLLRVGRPASYLLAPIAGGIALYFVPMQYIFLILGLIVLLGIIPATTMRDTK